MDADLEFQRRGDAVARLETVVLRRLPMGVQVDETRSHHQSLGVDCGECRARSQRRRGDSRDLAAADTDVAHRIEVADRIEHAPVGDGNVVCLRKEGDTALAKGLVEFVSISSAGTPATAHLNVLQVWIKGPQGWQLVARQATKVNPLP